MDGEAVTELMFSGKARQYLPAAIVKPDWRKTVLALATLGPFTPRRSVTQFQRLSLSSYHMSYR